LKVVGASFEGLKSEALSRVDRGGVCTAPMRYWPQMVALLSGVLRSTAVVLLYLRKSGTNNKI